MVHEAITWAWKQEVTTSQRVVLLALADMTDQEHSCFPGQKRLSDMTGLSSRSVVRVLNDLEEKGLIARERRFRQNGTRTSDRYVLASRPGATVSPVTVSPDNSDVHHVPNGVSTPLIEPPVEPSVRIDRFEEFWKVYPRREAKVAARKAFEKAVKSVGADAVLAGARRYAADPNLPDKQFVPLPTSWLNQGRWDDEPLPVRNQDAPQRGYVDDMDWAR